MTKGPQLSKGMKSGAPRQHDVAALRAPASLVGELRRWYMNEIEGLALRLEPELRSGYYREWHDGDAETFLGPWDGDDIPPSFRLERLCCKLAPTDASARLVLAVSPNASRIDSGALSDASPVLAAAQVIALDVLTAARRRGIRASSETDDVSRCSGGAGNAS